MEAKLGPGIYYHPYKSLGSKSTNQIGNFGSFEKREFQKEKEDGSGIVSYLKLDSDNVFFQNYLYNYD